MKTHVRNSRRLSSPALANQKSYLILLNPNSLTGEIHHTEVIKGSFSDSKRTDVVNKIFIIFLFPFFYLSGSFWPSPVVITGRLKSNQSYLEMIMTAISRFIGQWLTNHTKLQHLST